MGLMTDVESLTVIYPNPPIVSKVAPPQKFKRPPFRSDATINAITSIQNFIQIHQ
jgi:hypothetical protein